MDTNDLRACRKCGCIFDEDYAIFERNKTEWYGTNCKAKCPACKNIIEFNLGDGYYK